MNDLMPDGFTRIRLDAIDPCPTNRELTAADIWPILDSVREHGVLFPVVVRPLAALPGRYVLIDGERRWSAARHAGHNMIPARVVDVDDVTAEMFGMIANAQRLDLTPLQQAEAFSRVIDCGKTPREIAYAIGHTVSYVRDRLALRSLCDEGRARLAAGELPLGHAVLIARVPSDAAQDALVRQALGDPEALADPELARRVGPSDPAAAAQREIRIREDDDIADAPPSGVAPRPMTELELRLAIRRHHMRPLSMATFPLDVSIEAPGSRPGACEECPSNTANRDAETLPGLAPRAPLCTDLVCFRARSEHAYAQAQVAAERDKVRVIEPARAAAMFADDGHTLRPRAPVVDPDELVPPDLLAPGARRKTWRKLLGAKVLEAAPAALVQDPSGAPRRVLDRRALVEAGRAAGKIDKPAKPARAVEHAGTADAPARGKAAKSERGAWVDPGAALDLDELELTIVSGTASDADRRAAIASLRAHRARRAELEREVAELSSQVATLEQRCDELEGAEG